MKIQHSTAIATVMALSCLPIVGAQASLVSNGSFEDPVLANGSWSIFGSITGWNTVSGSGIEVQNHAAGLPYAGNQLVELDSNDNSAMSQTIATSSGQSYSLSLAYSPRPGVGSDSNVIDVFWDGVLLDSITADGSNLADTVWTVHNYNVTASGSSAVLMFAANGTNDSLGGYIDDVSLTTKAVPEPASIALLGMGLIGLGAVRRKAAR